MVEFIKQYWLQVLFGGIVSALSLSTKHLYKVVQKERNERKSKAEKESKEQALLKQGVLALLHDRIYQICQYYIDRGGITIEALNNLECLYKGYSGIGGNGTGEILYKRCKALPIVPPDAIQEWGKSNESNI